MSEQNEDLRFVIRRGRHDGSPWVATQSDPGSIWDEDEIETCPVSELEEVKAERDALATGKLPTDDHPIARAEEAEARADQAEGDREELRKRLGRAEELLGEYGAGGTPAGLIGGIHNLAHIGEAAQRNFESAKKRAEQAEQQAASMREERDRLLRAIRDAWPIFDQAMPGSPVDKLREAVYSIPNARDVLSQPPTDVEEPTAEEWQERHRRCCKRAEHALDVIEGYRGVLERIATETRVVDIQGEYEKSEPLTAAECRALAASALDNPPAPQQHVEQPACTCLEGVPNSADDCPIHQQQPKGGDASARPDNPSQGRDRSTVVAEPGVDVPGARPEISELAEDLRAMARDAERPDLFAPAEWAEPLNAAADRLDAQPAPVLSDKEQQRVQEIADIVDVLDDSRIHLDDSDLLRNLASQEHRGEECELREALKLIAESAYMDDPESCLKACQSIARKALANETGADKVRCECCRKAVPRADAEVNTEDGVWLCLRCIDSLNDEESADA